MQLIKTEGLVVRASDSGQSDKNLTVITKDLGKVYVYARGARNINSKFLSASQLFAYSSFVIDLKDGRGVLHEGDLKMNFFKLRSSVTKMALASYFADVLDGISVEKGEDDGSLALTLNCLYLLSEDKRPEALIKSVFEMKIAECIGLYPDLSACDICGKLIADHYYLDVMNGRLICGECGLGSSEKKDADSGDVQGATAVIGISGGALTVLQRILYAEKGKQFSFSVSDKIMKEVSSITEAYLMNQLEYEPKTLKFYKDLTV